MLTHVDTWPSVVFQTFSALVDNAQLSDAPLQPVEFVGDREITFKSDVADYENFQVSTTKLFTLFI